MSGNNWFRKKNIVEMQNDDGSSLKLELDQFMCRSGHSSANMTAELQENIEHPVEGRAVEEQSREEATGVAGTAADSSSEGSGCAGNRYPGVWYGGNWEGRDCWLPLMLEIK